MIRLPWKKMQFLIFSIVLPFLYGVIAAKVSVQLILIVLNTKGKSSSPLANPYSLISSSAGNLDPESLLVNSVWLQDTSGDLLNSSNKVWVVTPTYCRDEQLADLTQTAQALYPAREFIRWLIFDEVEKCSEENIKRIRYQLAHFRIPMQVERTRPFVHQLASKSVKHDKRLKGKGVMARRIAIEFLRERKVQGVVYFADDDNTYDSEMFFQMRNVEKVGVLPVGAMFADYVSSPIVEKTGNVNFFDGWIVNRKFPLDFGGFATNLKLIHENPSAQIKDVKGYLETYFLEDLGVEIEDFEPLASNCTEILTWHTKTSPRAHSMSLSEMVAEPLMKIFKSFNPSSFVPSSFLNGTNIPILHAKYVI